MSVIRKWLLNNKNSRPPFLIPPLRSLGFKLDDELLTFTMFAVGFPIFFFLFIIYASIFNNKHSSISYFIGLLIGIIPFFIIIFFYCKRKLKIIRNYRLDFIGEKVVGQEL